MTSATWLYDILLQRQLGLTIAEYDQLVAAIIQGMPRDAMVQAARAALMLKAQQAETSPISVDDAAASVVHSIELTLTGGV